MSNYKLPPHLVSLVHYVELSKAGWIEKAQDLIVLAVLVDKSKGVSYSDILTDVNSRLSAPLGQAQLRQIIGRLLKDGSLIEVENEYVRLSQDAAETIRENMEKSAALEQVVKEEFEDLFSDILSKTDITWQMFRDEFLAPLVIDLGAQSYSLLTGNKASVRDAATFLEFVDRVNEEHRAQLSSLISEFLDPEIASTKSFVLRMLNAAFVAESLSMSSSVIEEVMKRTKERLKLQVMCDTNFIFSLIGLHENPADDVVDALHHLVDDLKDKINIQLYILPVTVDEARRTISGYESRLSGMALPSNIAKAAYEGIKSISGITLKYLQSAANSTTYLSATDYFGPYFDNLLSICRDNGIELYNESMDKYAMDQSVIDDVIDQQEYEKNVKLPDRQKSYEKLLHDVSLWYFVRRKRPDRLDSPVDAIYWVATLDHSLLRFDRFKVKTGASDTVVCIHPTVLLQLLQLWIPRSVHLESALMDSLRPVIPHIFDREAEGVTIRILRSLSRFEGASDISIQTIGNILVSEAVRTRVQKAQDEEEETEIIHSAVAEENKALDSRARKLHADNVELSGVVRRQKKTIRQLRGKIQEIKEATEEKSRDWEEKLDQERNARVILDKRLYKLEDSRRKAKAWQIVVLWSIVVTLILASAGMLVSAWISTVLPVRPWLIWILIILVALGGGGATMDIITQASTDISETKFALSLRKASRFLWGSVILAIVIGIVVAIATPSG